MITLAFPGGKGVKRATVKYSENGNGLFTGKCHDDMSDLEIEWHHFGSIHKLTDVLIGFVDKEGLLPKETVS